MKTLSLAPPQVTPLVRLDIRKLTEAVGRGDEAAFNQLHARYSLPLFQRLLWLTRGDEPLSRELAQTALLQLARRAPVCENEEALCAWLHLVAKRAWLDVTRKASRQQAEPFDDADLPAHPSVSHPLNEPLQMALAELSPDVRELLQAFYLDKQPIAELAAERGLTYKALESRLTRLRTILRNRILHLLSQ